MPTSHRKWHRSTATASTPKSKPLLSARRQWLLGGTMAVTLLALSGRLAYWQINQQQLLATRAYDQHQHVIALPSGRGSILDAHGTVLAMTVTGNAIVIDPLLLQSLASHSDALLVKTASELTNLTGILPTDLLPQLRLATGYHILLTHDGSPFHADVATSQQIQSAIDGGMLPGMAMQPQSWRYTPGGSLASQILGFVQRDSGLGQYGIEQQNNDVLAGTSGQFTTTLDAAGNPLAYAPQSLVPAKTGDTVTLTLDATIQQMAEDGLHAALTQTGAASGTVIIADPQTGALLAVANAPTFDPNQYNDASLASLPDPAVSATYDPGSTMKALTMAMGIDAGVITPDTTIEDTGSIIIGGQQINNWNHLAWGTETMTQVLTHSANVGAAWVAVNQIGHDRFYNYLHNFGLCQTTGVQLPGEVAGTLPPSAANQSLAALDLAENSFGESIAVTPLQMVMAYSALANGGQLMQPRIVTSVTHDGKVHTFPLVTVRRVISQPTAAVVTHMLSESALHSDAQTNLISGYSVAAKTGTSTPDPLNPSATFATVLGYAPTQQPRFVVLVKLDKPQSSVFGGEAAGPLWRTLVRQLMVYAHIPTQEGVSK